MTPGMLAALSQMNFDIDVRDVVPSVGVPTLVIHRRHHRLVAVRHSRWLADHFPNAKLVEVPGDDHTPWYQDRELTLGEIGEFLTGTRSEPDPGRILATVLFTDIVDSTGIAAELGDVKWRPASTDPPVASVALVPLSTRPLMTESECEQGCTRGNAR